MKKKKTRIVDARELDFGDRVLVNSKVYLVDRVFIGDEDRFTIVATPNGERVLIVGTSVEILV